MKKIICPVCNKDLTESLQLLGWDFKVHIDSHILNCDRDIAIYMNKNIDDIPTELAVLLKKKREYITKLYEYNEELGD